jgi:hypothetical protein
MCTSCKETRLLPEFEAILNEFETTYNETAMSWETAPSVVKPMVDPKKVSCAGYNKTYPIFKAIGTTDPAGALEKIVRRAVTMMDNTIAELNHARVKINAGEPIGWPLLNDTFALSLGKRMRIKVEDRTSWTGEGPGKVGLVIRWLGNIRKIMAGGHIWYTCLSSECSTGDWAWVYNSSNAENIRLKRNFFRIHLCSRFWKPKTGVTVADHFEFQAQTIIHEASHIYYHTSDKTGTGAGVAECITQFIAETNNSPIDQDFIKRCGGQLI